MTNNEKAYMALLSKAVELGTIEHYHNDLIVIDKNFLLGNEQEGIKVPEHKSFIWGIGDCGTHIVFFKYHDEVLDQFMDTPIEQVLESVQAYQKYYARYSYFVWSDGALIPVQLDDVIYALECIRLKHKIITADELVTQFVSSLPVKTIEGSLEPLV